MYTVNLAWHGRKRGGYTLFVPAIAKTDRETILRAALARLGSGGIASLSLRALAADVGIATNALYHYFPSRAHLESALANEAAGALLGALQRRLQRHNEGPRMQAFSEAYLLFARRQPHLYDLMCSAPCETGQSQEHHETLWGLVMEEVALVHGSANAARAATSLWALLHGAVGLERAGVLGGMKPRDSVQFGLDAWMWAANRDR